MAVRYINAPRSPRRLEALGYSEIRGGAEWSSLKLLARRGLRLRGGGASHRRRGPSRRGCARRGPHGPGSGRLRRHRRRRGRGRRHGSLLHSGVLWPRLCRRLRRRHGSPLRRLRAILLVVCQRSKLTGVSARRAPRWQWFHHCALPRRHRPCRAGGIATAASPSLLLQHAVLSHLSLWLHRPRWCRLAEGWWLRLATVRHRAAARRGSKRRDSFADAHSPHLSCARGRHCACSKRVAFAVVAHQPQTASAAQPARRADVPAPGENSGGTLVHNKTTSSH